MIRIYIGFFERALDILISVTKIEIRLKAKRVLLIGLAMSYSP